MPFPRDQQPMTSPIGKKLRGAGYKSFWDYLQRRGFIDFERFVHDIDFESLAPFGFLSFVVSCAVLDKQWNKAFRVLASYELNRARRAYAEKTPSKDWIVISPVASLRGYFRDDVPWAEKVSSEIRDYLLANRELFNGQFAWDDDWLVRMVPADGTFAPAPVARPIMPAPRKTADTSATGLSGYLALDDKTFRFDSARWSFDHGHLYLDAESRRCMLSLVGIPFKDVSKPEDLVGKVSAPGWDEISPGDDIFAEGGLSIRGECYDVTEIRVEVRTLNEDSRIMKVAIQMKVEGRDSGQSGDVECQLACEPASNC